MVFTKDDFPITLNCFCTETHVEVDMTFTCFDEWVAYCKKLHKYIQLFGDTIPTQPGEVAPPEDL